MLKPRVKDVVAFIDWNSQVHNAPLGRRVKDEEVIATEVLGFSLATIKSVLQGAFLDSRFSVSLRFYSGWRKGFEPSVRRKALQRALSATDFSLFQGRNVVFRSETSFGDQLRSAVNSRTHKVLNCQLTNTLRMERGRPREKLVDTALASEVVDWAHRDFSDWLLILAEDDDLVPPVMIAEGIRGTSGGRVLLLRRRPEDKFLKLGDLRCAI
jgi:hypothetical protein